MREVRLDIQRCIKYNALHKSHFGKFFRPIIISLYIFGSKHNIYVFNEFNGLEWQSRGIEISIQIYRRPSSQQ